MRHHNGTSDGKKISENQTPSILLIASSIFCFQQRMAVQCNRNYLYNLSTLRIIKSKPQQSTPFGKILARHVRQRYLLHQIPLPFAFPCPFVRILPVIVPVFMRKIRTAVQILLLKTAQTRPRQHRTPAHEGLPLRNFSSHRQYLRRIERNCSLLEFDRMVMRSVDRKGILVNRLDMFLQGQVPIDHPALFVGESSDLLLVSSTDKRFVVVTDSGVGPRNVICIEGTHQQNIMLTNLNRFIHRPNFNQFLPYIN